MLTMKICRKGQEKQVLAVVKPLAAPMDLYVATDVDSLLTGVTYTRIQVAVHG